jgi:hypothetical protein
MINMDGEGEYEIQKKMTTTRYESSEFDLSICDSD